MLDHIEYCNEFFRRMTDKYLGWQLTQDTTAAIQAEIVSVNEYLRSLDSDYRVGGRIFRDGNIEFYIEQKMSLDQYREESSSLTSI